MHPGLVNIGFLQQAIHLVEFLPVIPEGLRHSVE